MMDVQNKKSKNQMNGKNRYAFKQTSIHTILTSFLRNCTYGKMISA